MMNAANENSRGDRRRSSPSQPRRAHRVAVDAIATTAALLLAAATVATTFVTPARADSCAVCDCVAAAGGGASAGTEMTCFLAGLSSLPVPPADAVRVDVRRNNITTLVNGSLPSLVRLAFLDLSRNEISAVQPAAFAGLHALTELRLNNNRFSRLPDFVFKDLEQLQTLQLRENNIDDLRAVTFYNLRNLVSLDLGGNQLSSLPANVFVPLIGLQTLVLDNNVLGALPDSLLVMQASLVSFSAASNSIVALPQAPFFAASPAIAVVDLSLNTLASVPDTFFAGAASLASVRLDGAALTCDCSQSALRLWMDGAAAASARSAWLAAPQTSGTCVQPPALQGRYVINVSASSFVCTTTAASTTPPPPPTTTKLVVVTSDGRVSSGASSGGAAATTGGGDRTAAALSGGPLSDTAAIVLGSCVGLLALLVTVTLALVLCRRRRARKGRAPAAAAPSQADAVRTHSNGQAAGTTAAAGSSRGQHATGQAASKNSFSPPTRHVQLLSAAAETPLPLERNPTAASAAAEAASRAAALARARAVVPPPTMNGLVPYAHARRHRAGSSDQPDAGGRGGGGVYPTAVPPFYVDPSAVAAPADFFSVQRHAPVYLSARGTRDDRRSLEGQQPPPAARNGPSTSSLRAAKPSHLLAVVGGGWHGAPQALRATPAIVMSGGSGHLTALTVDGGGSGTAHAQVTVLPSQGSVDSGVHSLTPGGCYYTDAAGTPSTHRSFSPLSNDAIFLPDGGADRKPPLLEPRRYKNDTFV